MTRRTRSFREAILVESTTTLRYLRGSLAQEACGDGYGVTTDRDKPLKPGGSVQHALLDPCPSSITDVTNTYASISF